MSDKNLLFESESHQKKFPEYKSLEHFDRDHENYVVVNWCIGNTCNYSCSYCPSGLHDGSKKWPEFETVARFCNSVIKHYEGKKIYFEFTGGEVTLWKDILKLFQLLKFQDCRTGIISNGSRSHRYWEKLIPLIDHVCLSYHPESCNQEHFLETVKMCADKIRTHVNFMMHPDYFSDCVALAYKVKDVANISIAIQPLNKDMGEQLYDYTDAQRKVIITQNGFLPRYIPIDKSFESYRGSMEMVTEDGEKIPTSPQRLISSGNNSWKGWNCYAGVEQIVVDMDGNIFRGWCLEGGKIANIADRRLKLPTKPVVCKKNFCHCNLDIMTRKERREKLSWQEWIGLKPEKSRVRPGRSL